MSWLNRTGVQVPVVLRQQVNIVKYKTVPGKVFQRLHESNIEELPSVKSLAVGLKQSGFQEYLVELRRLEYFVFKLSG